MLGKAVAAMLCLLPLAAAADQGGGFEGELDRFRMELWGNRALLSPGVISRLETEAVRLEQMDDRDQAALELRALEREMHFSHTALPGAYEPLTGPEGRKLNVYASPDAISSPQIFLPGGW